MISTLNPGDGIYSIEGAEVARKNSGVIAIGAPSIAELWMLLIMCLAGTVIGFIPGYRIYRYSFADGMTIRV